MLKIIDPLQYPEWDALVRASHGYSFFHTSFWARVLHDSYDYKPCYLTIIRDGKLDLLVPMMEVRSVLTGKRGVSLPFTDYCDPIMSQDAWQEVMSYLYEYGKNAKWNYLEVRGGKYWPGHVPFSSFYYRHDLNLSAGGDTAYDRLKSSTKRNIRKAIREGITIKRSAALDAVKTFYRLHCMTRKKHGCPPQPFHFFQKIFDHIISRNHGQVILALCRGKAIAGGIFFHFGDEAIYKFGASDNNYLHLRPNDLVMWEAIQGYAWRGYHKFSFGRTDPDNEGLREYKKGWGAEEAIVKYHKYDLDKREYIQHFSRTQPLYEKIFSRMPIPVLKMAGSILYKHTG